MSHINCNTTYVEIIKMVNLLTIYHKLSIIILDCYGVKTWLIRRKKGNL